MTNQENPFLKIKIRTLIFWLILSLLGGVFLLASILIALGLSVLLGNPDLEPTLDYPDPFLIKLLAYFWLYGLISLWCFVQIRRSRLKFKQLLGKIPRDRDWVNLLLLVAPLLLFSFGSEQLLLHFLPKVAPDWVVNLLKHPHLFLSAADTRYPQLYNATLALVLVVIAPVVEEILFRGLLLQRWGTKWGLAAGLSISSLVFGILHLNWIGFFCLGVVMAVLYLKTRTLLIPIFVRALNNGMVVVLSAIAFQAKTPVPPSDSTPNSAFLWLGLLSVGVSAPWLILYLKKNWLVADDSLPYWANAVEQLTSPQS